MKRSITITIPTDDEEVNLVIKPAGKDVVLLTAETNRFCVSTKELNEAMREAEFYRNMFENKERAEQPNPKIADEGAVPVPLIVEIE